jgi:hypothetical protein
MNMRRIEFLQVTANPFDAEIMGKSGRGTVLREVAKSLQMPEDEVVPSREKAAMQARTEPAVVPGPGQPGGMQALPAPTQATPMQPDGSPKGGGDGNIVS